MALIPIPSRGSPLDVDLLISIITEFNNIKSFYERLTSKIAQFKGRQVTMSDLSIQAFVTNVVANSSVTTTTSKTTPIQFSPAFKEAPVVSATVTGNAYGTTVSLNNITPSAADLITRFSGSDKYDINIHVVAIGLPI